MQRAWTHLKHGQSHRSSCEFDEQPKQHQLMLEP